MRLIDADALHRVYMSKGKDKLRLATVINELEMQKTIDAVPVVHGRWGEWWPGLSVIMTGEEMLWQCSVCTAKYADKENLHYCPNCGAKMEGENNG